MIPNLYDFVKALGHHEVLMNNGFPFFSQSGEDVITHVLLRNEKVKGMFVDFGAYHPFKFSNTFTLYLDGWRG